MSFKTKYENFSLVEMLVVIAVLALLISLLQPSFSKLQEVSQNLTCKSSLKSRMLASGSFAGDHNGYFPRRYSVPSGGPQPYYITPYKSSSWDDSRSTYGTDNWMSYGVSIREWREYGLMTEHFYCPSTQHTPFGPIAGQPEWTGEFAYSGNNPYGRGFRAISTYLNFVAMNISKEQEVSEPEPISGTPYEFANTIYDSGALNLMAMDRSFLYGQPGNWEMISNHPDPLYPGAKSEYTNVLHADGSVIDRNLPGPIHLGVSHPRELPAYFKTGRNFFSAYHFINWDLNQEYFK